VRFVSAMEHGPAFDYRGLGAGAVQITLAERVTRLHKSAFPTAFFKSKIGEGNAARRSSADATAKGARRAVRSFGRAAPQAASATAYRRGSLRVLLLCSWSGFISLRLRPCQVHANLCVRRFSFQNYEARAAIRKAEPGRLVGASQERTQHWPSAN